MKQLRLIAATVLLSVPFVVSATPTSSKVKSSRAAINKQALLIELTGKDFSKENDVALYAQIVSAYQSNNEIGFKSRLQSLLSRFPKSPYSDNALFLAGRMAVNQKNYAQAIRYFGEIEKKYPHSNKVVSAKFAKAMTYKKMNLPEFAQKTLKEVKGKFPGSPESFRADAELKILK